MTCPPMRTLAFLTIKEWKFVEPVFIGDTIRVRARVVEKEERSRGRRGVVTWHRQIVNQDNKTTEEGSSSPSSKAAGSGGRWQESGTRNQKVPNLAEARARGAASLAALPAKTFRGH